MNKKEDSFEENLNKLEKIVENLEKGTLGLESVLEEYKEGMKIYNICNEILENVKGEVETIEKNE